MKTTRRRLIGIAGALAALAAVPPPLASATPTPPPGSALSSEDSGKARAISMSGMVGGRAEGAVAPPGGTLTVGSAGALFVTGSGQVPSVQSPSTPSGHLAITVGGVRHVLPYYVPSTAQSAE